MPAHTETRTFQNGLHRVPVPGFGVDLEPLAELAVIAKPIVRQFVRFR
jgi:hypothetical protein